MTKHRIALAIALALTTAFPLTGCDRASALTEQEHIQRAKDFEDKGDLKAGILELKNAVQKNPNGPQSRLLLSQLYIKAGLGPSAEKELRKALQLGISLETVKVPLGEALLLQQKFKETLDEVFASEQTSTPNRARILGLRGDATLGLGKLEEACALYEQSKAVDNQQTVGYRGLAQCALAKGDLDQAIQQLNTALKIDDKDARNWILMADIETRRSNHAAAEKAYGEALKVAPGNPATHMAMAAFQIRQGNAKAAEKRLDEIETRFGANDPRWHSLKALLAFQQNRLEEADSHLGQILRVEPGHIPTLFLAGVTNYGLGRFEQATAQLGKVLTVAPGLKPARVIQASIKLKQGQVDEAAALIEGLDVERTNDPVLLLLAGQIAQARGDRDEAERYLALARRIDPEQADRPSTALNLAALDVHAAVKQLSTPFAESGKSTETAAVEILALIQHREFERALAAIARLEEQQPKNPAVHNMRGVIAMTRQDWATARRNFDKALSLDPGYFHAAANLAQLDLRDGKPDAARQRMESLLKRSPRNSQAMLVLADISASQGKTQEYREWLEKARRAQPDLPDPALRLGRYHLEKGEPLKALDIARQLISAHPDHGAAMELLAQSQLASGDKASAVVSLTKLTALMPQSAGTHYQLARLQLDQKNLKAAKASLAKAVAIRPDYYEALHALAMLELAEKKPEDALKIARDAQSRAPRSPAGLILQGDVHMAQGKFPEAAQAFEKALAMTDMGPVQIKLHQALRRSGQAQAADARLLPWMKAHPRDIAVRYYLGEVALQARNHKQAIDYFKAVVQLAPQHAMALNNLAWLYDQEGNPLALKTAEQVYRLAPDSPVVQDTFGWILLRDGQTARSLELLRKAAGSRDPSMQFHYAAALAKSGDKQQARSLLKQLLASKRDFAEAKQAEALLKQL